MSPRGNNIFWTYVRVGQEGYHDIMGWRKPTFRLFHNFFVNPIKWRALEDFIDSNKATAF
jgi:hypothetical protein